MPSGSVITLVCVCLCVCVCVCVCGSRGQTGPRPLCAEVSRSHTIHTHTLGGTPMDKGSARLKGLPGNIQYSQKTDTYATGGIRTRNPSKRTATDPRLRPHGHQDRRSLTNH